MTSTRITLVRHGETTWNRDMRLQGSRDIPLSELGLAQAERVADRLLQEAAAGTDHHRVYSSHLSRAHTTAATIAEKLGLPHHVHDSLHERSYGELEGLTRDEILALYPDFWGVDSVQHKAQGVESVEAVRERAHRALEEIAAQHQGEHVVIVSHGGTINALLHRLSEGQYGTGINRLGNTSVTRVERRSDGTWHIVDVGCTRHLSDE